MFPEDTLVLVVDDTSTMRRVVSNQIKSMGFKNIVEAGNGQIAFDTILKQFAAGKPVGLVLSDWNMPEMAGIDLLRRVRADARFKALPFILITAEIKPVKIEEASVAGVSGYLVKPFSLANLREKIEQVSARQTK